MELNSEYDLSIIITLFNRKKMCLRALKSCISLDIFKEMKIEVLIVDDGSKDNPLDVLSEYIDNTSIKYFYKDNGGAASAKNFGARKAKGEYIVFLDSDDYFLSSNCFSELKRLINKKIDFIFSDKIFLKTKKKDYIKNSEFKNGKIYDYMLEFPLNYAGLPAYFFKRKKFTDCGGFVEHHKWGDALLFWRIFLKNAEVACIYSENYAYDLTDNSNSVSRTRDRGYYQRVFKTLIESYIALEYELKIHKVDKNWVLLLLVYSILAKEYKWTFKFMRILLISPFDTYFSIIYLIKRIFERYTKK